jgi:hypothetical protein
MSITITLPAILFLLILTCLPIAWYFLGKSDGYAKRCREMETDFDFEKQKEG